MSRHGAFICWARWCLLLVFAWLIQSLPVLSQPADMPSVKIEIVEGIHLGEPVEVSITWTNSDSTFEVGGFDLLIAYDPSGLMPLGVDQGQLLTDCEWEYFSYRMETPPDTCVYWCPPMVRIVAVAETNNGPVHPSCYLNVPGELARLHFLATRSPGALGTLYPVRFFWMDCGDNTFASKTGDSLFASHYVIEFGHGGFAYRIENEAYGFPTYFGVQSECLGGGDPSPIQFIDFYNGSVELSCQDTSTAGGASVALSQVGSAFLRDSLNIGIDLYGISSDLELGGFDFLVQFDSSGLIFLGAEQGQLLVDCEWEYFTYQHYPEGRIRVVAVAETNNGAHHPTCWANNPGRLASLSFRVPFDSSLMCQTLPLSFIWFDCGDNTVATKTGDSLLLSREVFNFYGFPITADSSFPTPYGAPEECLSGSSGGTEVTRAIDYFNSRVRVACDYPTDQRGDINLNGIPYEIADWVLFAIYFTYGLDAFHIDTEAQSAATDVNADGIILTLDDLVYMWRVIIGDALPYPKLSFNTAVFTQDAETKTVSIAYPDSLTAVYLILRGDVVPISQVGELDLSYHFDGVHTRVLGFPDMLWEPPPYFDPGPLLIYTGIGVLEEAYTSDYGVLPIPTAIEIPTSIDAKTEIEPVPMFAYWAFTIDPIIATVYLGNIDGQGVTDIDAPTLRVNNVIEPISTQILTGRPEFSGEVMEITFSATEFVRGYLPFYDSTSQVYSMSGQFTDQSSFVIFGDVTMVGHISSDVTLDGQVNVSDLTYLVEFMFRGGSAPPDLKTADVDGDGGVTVSDLTALVGYLFIGP